MDIGGSSRRSIAWAAVLLAVAVLVAACGGSTAAHASGSSTAPGRPIAATDDVATKAASTSDQQACTDARQLFLGVITGFDSTDLDDLSPTAQLRVSKDFVAHAPATLARPERSLIALARAMSDPAAATNADTDTWVRDLNTLLAWATKTCRPAKPVWACVDAGSEGVFEPVGKTIGGPPDTSATPDAAALASEPEQTGHLLTITSTSSTVLVGWADTGVVVHEIAEVKHQRDGRWAVSRETGCPKQGQATFHTVGSTIP